MPPGPSVPEDPAQRIRIKRICRATCIADGSGSRSIASALLCHNQERPPREVVVHDDGQSRLRFSIDSPLRTTSGDLEAIPHYAGRVIDFLEAVMPAADRLGQIVEDARSRRGRLTVCMTPQGDPR